MCLGKKNILHTIIFFIKPRRVGYKIVKLNNKIIVSPHEYYEWSKGKNISTAGPGFFVFLSLKEALHYRIGEEKIMEVKLPRWGCCRLFSSLWYKNQAVFRSVTLPATEYERVLSD